MNQPQWQFIPRPEIPQWFLTAIRNYNPDSQGNFIAQLLWQRGIRDLEQLKGFIDVNAYQPSSPFDFGQEMKWATQRLQQARNLGQRVAIWGDFDADGVTATSVLWEGLGQFFVQELQLTYYIPNRLQESHGLNNSGIKRLAEWGAKIIVTCDTGSTNLAEISYAKELGIDIIITDHHTLPEERPDVISIINPRYFAVDHPLYHLSGVAVAYKLVEALYLTLPHIPQQPLEELLDLVAIGLIADLVKLSGDCRYLAQKGIAQLKKQSSPETATRPGVARLLELCQKTGDRPTDISFGLGPRINAVSRIHGDARFCVELLTSRDSARCQQLALETELANTRRKALQKDVTQQVQKQLETLDLSTTGVIVLENSQWQGGVLGLVAGQIAQEYGRPTILLSSGLEGDGETGGQGDEEMGRWGENSIPNSQLARGSARSIQNIDLYQLVDSQSHLLHRFGGHPFAAGLSLLTTNIPLFREGINQQLRQLVGDISLMKPTIESDLLVTVADLGQSLFRELKLAEPYGMGNPVPKLLIKNCWFNQVRNKNIEDINKKFVQYIRTTFKIFDDSVTKGFDGVWWGHYQEEIPQNQRCDAIVELDYNTYKEDYEVRLVAVKPTSEQSQLSSRWLTSDIIIDWRNDVLKEEAIADTALVILNECPDNWTTLQQEYRSAIATDSYLALAYSEPSKEDMEQIWLQLIGIAKYLSRTGKSTTLEQLKSKLHLSDRTLALGLETLSHLGFNYQNQHQTITINYSGDISGEIAQKIAIFREAIKEDHFQRQYFSQIPVTTLRAILSQL